MSIDREALGRVKRVYAWLLGVPILVGVVLWGLHWTTETINRPDSIWYPLAVGLVVCVILSSLLVVSGNVLHAFGQIPDVPSYLTKLSAAKWINLVFLAIITISLFFVAYRWLTA